VLLVRTKTATYLDNVWYPAGVELRVTPAHYSPEVHELIKDESPPAVHVEPVHVEPVHVEGHV